MRNAEIIGKLLKQNAPEIIVEIKHITPHSSIYTNGKCYSTNGIRVFKPYSCEGDVLLTKFDCGLDPNNYSLYFGIIRGVIL